MFSQAQPLSSANSRGDCRRPASWDVLRFVGTVGATLLTAHRVPPRIESSAGELLEEIGAQLVSVRTWLSSSLRLSIGHLAGKQSPAPSWTSRAAGPLPVVKEGSSRLLSRLVLRLRLKPRQAASISPLRNIPQLSLPRRLDWLCLPSETFLPTHGCVHVHDKAWRASRALVKLTLEARRRFDQRLKFLHRPLATASLHMERLRPERSAAPQMMCSFCLQGSRLTSPIWLRVARAWLDSASRADTGGHSWSFRADA